MRPLAHIVVGFAVLVVVGATWSALFGQTRIMPDALAVIALYLGLTSRGQLAGAMVAAVGVGYLADILAGTPAGLYTSVAAVICFAAHVAQGRLVIGGRVAAIIASAAAALAAALLVLALARAVPGQVHPALDAAGLFGSAAVTGLVGPFVLALHRRLDRRLIRNQRRRAGLGGVA